MNKILAIIQTPEFGGPHNQILQLQKHLLAKGWEYHVLLPDELGSGYVRLKNEGIKIITTRIYRLRYSLNFLLHFKFLSSFIPSINSIRRIIRASDYEIIQVCGLLSIHGALAAWLEKKPIVWQLLGFFAPLPLRFLLIPLVNILSNKIMTTGNYIIKKHPFLSKRKVEVFYPPVNEMPLPSNISSHLFKDFDLVVGTVGNRYRAKRHDRLIKIAKEFHNKYFDKKVLFVIIGEWSKSNKKYYEKNVLSKINNTNVQILLPSVHIFNYISEFDIFLLTSDNEGVPTVILEAMSLNKPIISSKVGAINEIVFDGFNGYLCEKSDIKCYTAKLLDLINNPELIEKFGENSKKMFKTNFSIEICTKVHIKVFEDVLNC